MKICSASVSGAALAAGVLLATSSAHAAATITVRQVGNDVVFTGSGTINTLGLGSPLFTTSWIIPGNSNTSARVGSGNAWTFLYASGPSNFGPSGSAFGASASGDPFGVTTFNGRMFVPVGYVSGSPLSGTAITANRTLASLGFNEGLYTFTWGSGANADSLTVDVAIPAPGAAALLGLGGLMAARRRR